jgi:hypothetical protein
MKCTAALIIVALLACFSPAVAAAADCEDLISRHMIGQAMLTAQFVAAAEKAGMTPAQVNLVLKGVAENSAIEEIWITDSAGHAYLTNTVLISRSALTRRSSRKRPRFGTCSTVGEKWSSRRPESAKSMTRFSSM